MKEEKDTGRVIRCKHCGGLVRLYRDGINCIMCGRTMEHRCEECKHAEEYELEHKKVA